VVVDAVTDGPTALRSARRHHPDVIVLDISMPGMSGLEVAARLRESGSTAAVVFCTVHVDEEFIAATKAAGGLGYVVKPRLTFDLLRAVSEAKARRPFVSDIPGAASRTP
jgi:DNA-binding NarL/FixJ family response regulator